MPFPQVVEISSCEDTQALALRLILSLTKYNQQRIQEMDNCNGYSMIRRVLIKPKCIVGFCMLKVKSSSKHDILVNIRTNLETSEILIIHLTLLLQRQNSDLNQD